MRQNAATTLDPLRHEALPPFDGMELDYRRGGTVDACETVYAVARLAGISLTGLLIMAVLRTIGLSHWSGTPFALACLTLICTIAAAYSFAFLHRPWLAAFWAVSGPIIWGLVMLSRGVGQYLLFLAPVVLATYVAHEVVRHFSAWMNANPFLHRADRLAWAHVWQGRGARTDSDDSIHVDLDFERAERQRYSWVFGFVTLAALLGLATFSVHRPFAGLVALTLFVVVAVTFGVSNCLGHRREVPVALALSCICRAVISWLTYNEQEKEVPGLFRSPAGPSARRCVLLAVTVASLAATAIPLAGYFPVGIMFSPASHWVRASSSPLPWSSEEGPSLRLPSLPSRTDVERRLTPAQRTYLNQLGSEHRRRTFLNSVATAQYQADVTSVIRPVFDRLTSPPETWLWVACKRVLSGESSYAFGLIISVVLSTLTGPVVFFAVCFAVGSRVLVHHYLNLEAEGAEYHRDDVVSAWEGYQRRLTESPFESKDKAERIIRERDHVFLGLNEPADYPILLHTDILKEHAHFTGDSGSGKSSLGVAPLVAQLIGRPRSSIVVLDLKGDEALFECARIEAERHGVPFRWITNSPGQSTYAFNPFKQKHMEGLSRFQLAEVLLKSLGLEYGEGYGRAYFSSLHRDTMTRLLGMFPEIDSFRHLHRYLEHAGQYIELSREQRAHGAHLTTTINMLAAIDALNITSTEDGPNQAFANRIDMSDVISQPNVVYFFLQTQLQEATMREVAKLALFSLLTAAALNKRRDHQVYLFIDEFQQVASSDIEIVLRMARDSGIGAILANQTVSDLKTPSADLRPTIQANTRLKLIYSATDLAQQDTIIKSSGEALYYALGYSASARGGSFSAREQIAPRINRNDVISASDDENLSICHVSRGRGFSQFGGFPFKMYTAFHITNEEYNRRRARDWPKADEHVGAFVPPISRDETSDPAVVLPKPPQPPPADQSQYQLPKAVEQSALNEIELLLDDF